jgi:hypothetical protein
MTKELTDEEVFGTQSVPVTGTTKEPTQAIPAVPPPKLELSDEEVFGPQKEMTDEEVFGESIDPIDRFSSATKKTSEAEKSYKSSVEEYEKFSALPLTEADEPERIRLYAGARNAGRALNDEINAVNKLRPAYEVAIEEQKQAETASIEKLRENIITMPLADSLLNARDQRDKSLQGLTEMGLEGVEYNEQAKKIVSDYSNFVNSEQQRVFKENEENKILIRDLLNDSRRVFESGDRQVTTTEAIGGVAVGTPEYQNLASLAEDLGPEYVDQIISRSSTLRDKARGVVSSVMEGGILGAPIVLSDAVLAGIGAITTDADQAADKIAELENLREQASNGDVEAATELENQESELRNEALRSIIYELPLEERSKIRKDFLAQKQEKRLAGLPPERRQGIIDSTQKIMESYEASLFDPESVSALGAALPDGSLYLTAKGKMDINASIDKLVEAGKLPEVKSNFYKSYYTKLEEDRSRAIRGASIETTSFKNWLEENPEYAEEIKTDQGTQKALDAYEGSHNTIGANLIDIVPSFFKGIGSYVSDGMIGATLTTIALSDMSDEQKADKMLDVYIQEQEGMGDVEPTSFMGSAAEVTGNFLSQALPMVTLKFLSLFGPTKQIAKKLMHPARAYTMAHMGAVYAAQGYIDSVDQAVKESGYESIQDIQKKDPKLAEEINRKGQAAMIDAAKISISEQLPIEGLVSSIGSKTKTPTAFKRLMEALVFNPSAEIAQEIFADTLMQSSQSRYSAENKSIEMMSLREIAQMYVGVLPITGGTAIGARMEDRRQERIKEIIANLSAEEKQKKEAAEASAQAAERAAQYAPESASALKEQANNVTAKVLREAEAREPEQQGPSIPETRTIGESIRDKDTFVYQGMRGALTEEDGEVVFREFGTQTKYIVPVAPDQTIAEIEELQWQRRGQRRQVTGEPIEPTVVEGRSSVVERNPVVSNEEIDAEPDDIKVPLALVEIEKSSILNFLADLFDTGDSRAVQTEKAEYKSGKRKGQAYERETESPVTELPEYYRQATPAQLDQAKRLIDSALRLIDTMDIDGATKERLAEHFLLLDQDITNYEQNPEYKKFRQESGWQVSAIGQTGEVPTTATEALAAERELEARVRAETEAIERRKALEAKRAVTPPETPTGSRVRAAAYVAPDGTIYTADSHLNAMQKAADDGKITQAAITKKQKATSRETPEFGFTTESDSFISRDQAETLAKSSGQILVETPETGRLHSNEVALDDFTPDVDAPPYIARAIVDRSPISVEDVDRAGVEMPKGWKVDGDLYVYAEKEEGDKPPLRRMDAFARLFAYVQDYVDKNPAQAETLRNKVGLIVSTLNKRTIFDFAVNFQDAVITGIQNRLFSALNRGLDPKKINAATLVKSSLSDAKKTYPQEYSKVMDSMQEGRASGKKLDDILSGKVGEEDAKLTAAQKKTLEEEKRRTAAVNRRLGERKLAQRIVEDFEQTLDEEERLAFDFIRATERLKNDQSNKSKRRQADQARQRLEDAVEDYEGLVLSITGRFAELAERLSGQKLAPKTPKVKQTADGQKIAVEQKEKQDVLADVDAEQNKTEDLTDAEKDARAKSEDPNLNNVGAWVKTLPANSPLRRLINQILKVNPSVANVPIQYVAAINGRYDGFYDPNNNRIVLPQRPTQDINLVIGHEIIHATTLDKARLYDERKFDQLTKDELNIFKELDKIRNSMLANFGKGNTTFSAIMAISDSADRAIVAAQAKAAGKIGGELYALVNMAEFLANSINNVEFQKALDTIDPNIFRQIWNLIRSLFYKNGEPSASVNALWDSIIAISRETRVGGTTTTPAPSFVLPDYGIEGLPIVENKSDMKGLVDQAVLDRRISLDAAVKLKAILDFIPENGYRGAQVLFTDKITRNQRNAIEMGFIGKFLIRGRASFDLDPNLPTIIYINTSKAMGNPIKAFLHENAHVILENVATPEIVSQAREIYDSLPISRQAAFIANYRITGADYDTRFAEWFAESLVDYYEAKINEAGIEIDKKTLDMGSFDSVANKIYKKIVDLFSNERERINDFFDGLDATLFRAQREIARQAEDKIAPAAVSLRSDYEGAVKNGDYGQAKLIEEDAIGRILSVLTPDLLKRDYREANKTNATYGHCYTASEALYHMLGGKASGLRPANGRDANGVVHWWVKSKDGRIIDPTATQYTSIGLNPPYEVGKGGGFLTKDPSRRAQTVIDRVSAASMERIAPAAIESDKRKLSPEEYATYLEGLPQEVRDNIEVSENSRGYGLYEARQIAAKMQPNSTKFKKISDKYFVVDQDWDYIANVDGIPYGLVKEEDPDDENLQVWAYGKVGTFDFNETIYNVGMEEDVVREMQEDLASTTIAPAAVKIPPEEGGTLPPVTNARLEELGVRASETTTTGTERTYKRILETIARKGMSILDFGSGLGHGLKFLKDEAKRVGFEAIGYEPMWRPDRKAALQAPDYIGFESLDLIPDNSQDYIINNAVVNVVAEDVRATIVKQMYDKLKAGGTLFLQARSWTDVQKLLKNNRNIVVGPREIFVPQKQTFQKGFTPEELINFVESQLPDAKVVRTQFGGVGIAVTKPQAIAPAAVAPKISKVSDEYDASRVGTAQQNLGTETTQDTNVSIDTIEEEELAKQMADLVIIDGTMELPRAITSIQDPIQKRDALIEFVVDNLVALYNAFPQELRAAATRWYDGARLIAQDMSKEFGISNEQAAGILAAFSPMKEWFQNIELGIQFARIFRDHRTTKITKTKYAKGIEEVTNSASGITKAQKLQAVADRAVLLAQLEGRSIDGLWKESSRYKAKALKIKQSKGLNKKQYEALPEIKRAKELRELASWAVRVIATQEYGLEYKVYTPDGGILDLARNKDGSPSTLVWQSAAFIEKALSIAYDGSAKNISNNLGKRHKIRSFYNNIIAPNSPYEDVTVDTHAVNAAVLFPMGNTGKMVGDAFGDAGVGGGGNRGTYWLFREAYLRAAKKVGIQPRQMQSITWEAIRGLFPDDIKSNKSFVAEITNIWKNSPNARAARNKVIARGIRIPDWASAYTRGGRGVAESLARAGGVAESKANIARGLRNRVRSGDYGIAPAAIDPNLTPDPDSEDNTSNEAAAISAARADAKIAQESIIGHSILADEIPPELREELEATYKNGMTFEEFINSDTINLNESYYPYAIAVWLDLNGGLMPTVKIKDKKIDRLEQGTAESETVRMLNRAFTIYNSASDSVEGGKEITYAIGDIVSTWLRSGLDVAALRNAIVQFTNLDVNGAIAIAEDTLTQYGIQERIVDSRDRARSRMERAIPAITARQASEKERMIRLEQAAGTIDSIAEAIKLAYDVNVNKARVDRATEKKQIQEQLRQAKRILREVVPREYLGEQLTALERAVGLDGLKKIVEVAQDALNKARVDYAVTQARKSFDRASKAVKAGTLTPEAEAILRGFVDQYTKSGMSDKTKAEVQAVLDEFTNDPINALKRLTTTKSGKQIYAIDKYIKRKGQLSAIKIDKSLGLDALREITDIINSTMHMDKMAKGELLFNKKMKREEWKKAIMAEIGNIKTITKEEKGFGPKLGGFKWNTIFRGARVENILRGLGMESMRKFIYETLVLDAYNDELRNRIGLKKKIEGAFKQITGLEIGSKDYDKYSKQLFEVAGLDQNNNATTIQISRSEMIDMVASLRDANNFKKAVRAGGFVIDRLRGSSKGDTVAITPQSYMQLQDAMTESDLNMVNFVVNIYNNDLFTLLNDSSIQTYGHGIKKTNGVYYPRNAFKWDRVNETSADLDYMQYYNSRVDSVGHLKERTDEANARLVAVDFLSRLDYHVTNDSRISAYLAVVQDINSILKDGEVMRPLELKVGAEVVNQIQEMVRQQTVPLPRLADGLINTLVGNAGIGILGFKIHAALQNPVGIPIAMAYYGKDGYKYSAKALGFLRKGFNRGEYIKMAEVLNRYTPYFAERYGEGGFIQEFTSGLAAGPSDTRWRKNMEDKSLSWLEMTDKMGALARYKTAIEVIKDRTELEQGTEEFNRAVAREWNLMMFRSENTSHGADRTGFFQFAAKNPMAKIFIMFQSAVSKQYSLFAEAVIQAQQGGRENLQEAAMKMSFVAASVYMSLAISSAFYGILFPPDEEDETTVTDVMGRILSAPLSIVPVIGNTLQTMVAGWFSPENIRKPLQLDIISSFIFGTIDAFDLAFKGIRQIGEGDIDIKTGNPEWWNTSFKAIEKGMNLFGIAKGIPIGGLMQSGKFVKRLGERVWDSVDGDMPSDENFQKKLAKVKREAAPEPTTQEYAKMYFAVAENNPNKFKRALRDLKEKNPKATRDNMIASIRRRPEFMLVSMVERGDVKIGEHGITRDEYLSKRALRSSMEQLSIDMWREAKD